MFVKFYANDISFYTPFPFLRNTPLHILSHTHTHADITPQVFRMIRYNRKIYYTLNTKEKILFLWRTIILSFRLYLEWIMNGLNVSSCTNGIFGKDIICTYNPYSRWKIFSRLVLYFIFRTCSFSWVASFIIIYQKIHFL